MGDPKMYTALMLALHHLLSEEEEKLGQKNWQVIHNSHIMGYELKSWVMETRSAAWSSEEGESIVSYGGQSKKNPHRNTVGLKIK